MRITIGFANEQNDIKITNEIKALIREAIRHTLTYEQYGRSCEVSVCFTSEENIRRLNRDFRSKDIVTDVLSFPDGVNDPETGVILLGDVVLCTKRACEQAFTYGHPVERELAFLTVHSVLHLLGYDHELGESDEDIMRKKQTKIMDEMGLGIK